ncbi:MAG: Na/Pi cotransporter family protein [Gammaproteobacteria bacterium]|nr:Na/Pi cotransporter family protein [Gammaproteobacteria bacterium]NNJ97899.1 Na/Pi cotransporter family protein [Gammaproteobacteria bacterium]
MALLGGLAMFLYGMEQMSDGLQSAAGEKLKDVLAGLTKNRFLGALTGAFVTAVLNSSSVTTVLVVGFISAGFMTLTQSVGIIMGANIGSTFTAQIVAFNVTQYALLLVAVGFFMLFTAKTERVRHYGSMVMGLGLVFYGMGVMGEAMNPMRTYQPFLDLMIRMENPILGILVGAVFTGLVQSSAATTGIAIVMATEGLISLPAGIALSFGANIGTCVTALLAAIGKPAEAVRAAVVHVSFNIAGVLLWVMFIPQLAEFIVHISPSSPELSGKAQMAADVPRQIANAHTVFNLANTLIFIWFTPMFARFAEYVVREKPVKERVIVKPRYLAKELLEVPSVALENVRFEIGHMGEITSDMLKTLWTAFQQRDRDMVDEVIKMDDKVDVLSERILEYLSEIQQEELTDESSHELKALMSATINIESLADVIESELSEICKKYIDYDLHESDASLALFIDFSQTVGDTFDKLVRAIKNDDENAAAEVITVKEHIRHAVDEILKNQASRISVETNKDLLLVRLELELVDKLRRIYTLTKRVAREFIPKELAHKTE